MELNEHQFELLRNMLKLIEDFREGKIHYFKLVYGLQGILDAGNYESKYLVNQWHDLWSPLEELAAIKGNLTVLDDVDIFLTKLEIFLKERVIQTRCRFK